VVDMTTPAGTTAPIEPPVDAPRPFLASLSPSRASDFMTCPLLYRYRVVDRIPERPSRAAARGTLVHAVLEQLFDLPAAQRTQSAATERLAATWETLLADEPELTDLFTADAAALTQAADTTPPADTAMTAGTTGGVEAVVPPLTEFLREAERLLARYFTLEDRTWLGSDAARDHRPGRRRPFRRDPGGRLQDRSGAE